MTWDIGVIGAAVGLVGAGVTIGNFTGRLGLGKKFDGLGGKIDGLGTKIDHLAKVTVEGNDRIEKSLDKLGETLKGMREDQIRILERQGSGNRP